MKKILSSILVLSMVAVMLLGLVGCGDTTVDNPPVENPPVETPVEPPVENPVEPPVETPEEVVVTIDDIVHTMMDTFGNNYIPTMPLDADMFNMQLGIDNAKASEYYSEFYAGVPMMGTHVDKLFIVKTTDSNKMSETFAAYMKSQIEDTMQYPMNVSKLENYVITTQGDYVILFILGGYTDETPSVTEGLTEEQLAAEQERINVAYYVAQNEKALAALENLFENGYIGATEDTTEPPVEETTEPSTEGDVTTHVEGETTTDETVSDVVDAVVDATEKVADAIEDVVNSDTTGTGETSEAPSAETGSASSDSTNNQ